MRFVHLCANLADFAWPQMQGHFSFAQRQTAVILGHIRIRAAYRIREEL